MSKPAAELALQIKALNLPPPTEEFKFHPSRRWRFDFAWTELMLYAEVEGGIWQYGRHNRASGFIKDCEKYNAAALLGWRGFRFPTDMVTSGMAIKILEEALALPLPPSLML